MNDMDDLTARDAETYMHHAGSTPCLSGVRKAEGVWLENLSGHRFMDFHGNNVHHLGYGHPKIVAAVKAQLDELPFSPRGFTNEPAVQLAERLTRLWPGGAGRILLTTAGTTVVETAFKLARIATGRLATISFLDSYHGNGFGALSLGWRARDRERIGPMLEGPIHVRPFYRRPSERSPLPTDHESWAQRCLTEIEQAFAADAIAAVIAEPVRSMPHIPPAWFWPRVRELCDKTGALLVFDEIPTGLGKTGRLFVSEHFGVRPDITLLGKSLGGGLLPIAAMIAREDLNVAAKLPIGHFTHEKNPVTSRAAVTTLQVIEEEGLVAHARDLGARALDRLKEICAPYPAIRQVRGLGLLMAVEFADAEDSGRDPNELGEAVSRRALAAGLNVPASEGRGMTLSPPLTVAEDEMSLALDIMAEALAAELAP